MGKLGRKLGAATGAKAAGESRIRARTDAKTYAWLTEVAASQGMAIGEYCLSAAVAAAQSGQPVRLADCAGRTRINPYPLAPPSLALAYRWSKNR